MTFLTAQHHGRTIPAVMDISMIGFGDPEYKGAQTAPYVMQRGFTMVERNGRPSGLPVPLYRFANLLLLGHPFGEGCSGPSIQRTKQMNIPSKAQTLSASDLDSSITKEPRIHDERIGERLGLSRPRDIRKMIERNRSELESFGSLAPRCRKSRGQDFDEYWLNEEQALLICMFARTDRAAEVRREVITVFTAWRKGTLAQVPRRLPRWNPTRADMRDINSRASQILQTRFSAVRDALLAQIRADRSTGHHRPLSDYTVEPTTLLPANDADAPLLPRHPAMPTPQNGQALFIIDDMPVLIDFTDTTTPPDNPVIAIPVADGTGPERFIIEGTPPAPSWFDPCHLAKPRNSRDLIRPVVVVIGTIVAEGCNAKTRMDSGDGGDHRGFDDGGM
ncbi:hypothetical protein [Paremcibacter congregatus]|uniref:hypothetical protein n=1 Tax=Paremcibacter congregatus TaxID=2043170 RepID=UPI003A9059B9